eukprot:2504025-Pleurochrysis_carterae.AAC.2
MHAKVHALLLSRALALNVPKIALSRVVAAGDDGAWSGQRRHDSRGHRRNAQGECASGPHPLSPTLNRSHPLSPTLNRFSSVRTLGHHRSSARLSASRHEAAAGRASRLGPLVAAARVCLGLNLGRSQAAACLKLAAWSEVSGRCNDVKRFLLPSWAADAAPLRVARNVHFIHRGRDLVLRGRGARRRPSRCTRERLRGDALFAQSRASRREARQLGQGMASLTHCGLTELSALLSFLDSKRMTESVSLWFEPE